MAKSGKSKELAALDEQAAVRHWLDEIQCSRKREEKWRKNARNAIKIYEADDKVDFQFNILYSNTETLNPALYSQVPRPRAQRRYKDEDPIGLEASKTIQRTLEFLIDDGAALYPDFDALMGVSVLHALVAGRGFMRMKYDAYFVDKKNANAKTDEVKEFGDRLPGTSEAAKEGGKKLVWESVCGEVVPWDRFCHGYAMVWEDVPWIAMDWPMTRQEITDNFGPEIAGKIEYQAPNELDYDGEKRATEETSDPLGKIAWVHEIWDKRDKKVKFICPTYKEGFLKQVDDPLGLTGFFPGPEPLMFFHRVTGICPQTLYAFYEEQARELNRITGRINRLTDALKARGMYDGTIQNIERLFMEQDNALLPADNVAALYERGGLQNAIWFLPIENIINVLAQLHIQRAQIKQTIYEITGVSDILRGSSVSSETATAQKIKNQWGTLRLKNMQKAVQKYAVECLRIMAEIACAQFEVETFKKMTGLPYPTAQEKQMIQAQIQQVQQQAMVGQQPGMRPAQPPQIPPEMQMALQMPAWEDIVGLLRSDLNRNFKVDIETNSTVDADATEDRQNMTEMVNAMSQLIIGLQPLIENGSMPFGAAKSILLAMVRRFSLGDEVEDEIKQMQEPQAKSDPEAEKQKAELEKAQQDLQQQQGQMEIEKEKMKLQAQAQQADMQREQELQAKLMELERTIQQVKMDAKQAEFDTRMKAEQLISQFQLQSREQMTDIQHTAEEAELNRERAHEEGEIQRERAVADQQANLQRSHEDSEAKRKREAADQAAKAKAKEPKK